MADEPDDAAAPWEKVKTWFHKIVASPIAEREGLMRAMVPELRETHPDTIQKIAQWGRDGLFLYQAVESALHSALSRTDLSEDEKREALEDLVDCAAAIATIRDAPHGLVSAGIAMDVARSALFLGLRAGLSAHDIERLRREVIRSRQRASASGRVKQRQQRSLEWKLHAKAIAQRVRDGGTQVEPRENC